MPDVAASLAYYLVRRLREAGTRRIFGIPGGASSLTIIEAADRQGIDFVLTQSETAAALMAAVTAELGGAPGVVLTGIGPGAASVVNGVAYASLERTPLFVITDSADPAAAGSHQRFDQTALLAPLVRLSHRLDARSAGPAVSELLAAAEGPLPGPVHVELSAAEAGQRVMGDVEAAAGNAPPAGPAAGALNDVADRLSAAARPVVLAGMEARAPRAQDALRRLAATLRCPVLTTYKAKGVFPDSDPCCIGHVTGGAVEADTLCRSDLLVFFGLDPVELINAPWPYDAPIIDLAGRPRSTSIHPPIAAVTGPLHDMVDAVIGRLGPTRWSAAEVEGLRARMRERVLGNDPPGGPGPVVEAAHRLAPAGARLTVDSGAHMFSAMAGWRCEAAFDVLKSNGLSTMGYALPAAVASALHEPERPVVALTGDAGLAMCLGELLTAARLGARIAVIVFNDAALSLIDIKQQAAGHPERGVRYPRVDYAAIAAAAGWHGRRADPGELEPALAEAFAHPGPALVDVTVDPGGYARQLKALRG